MKTSKLFLAAILCSILSVSCNHVRATHLRGGYITYATDQQNPMKLHFTMYIFQNTESPVQENNIEVTYGDGTSTKLSQFEITSIGHKTNLLTYKWEHTIPSAGTYTISWAGNNRNASIVNIPSPSDQVSFYFSTTFNINPLRKGALNGARFISPSAAEAYVGKPFKYNLLAYDVDGDSLVYKLVTPRRIDAAGRLTHVPGYFIPEGLTINRYGEINWPNPTMKGEFAFALQVQEYRNNALISTTINEFQLLVNEIEQNPEVVLLDREQLPISDDNLVLAKPGSTVKLKFFVEKPDIGTIDITEYKSELLEEHLKESAALNVIQRDSANGILTEVAFSPSEDLKRSQPYALGIKGTYQTADRGYYHTGDRSWNYVYFVVGEQLPTGIEDEDLPEAENKITFYPNPAIHSFTIEAPLVPSEFIVYSTDGRIVYQTQLKPGTNTLERPAQLTAGSYLYFIRSRQEASRGKFVLE